jgi:hypothetical protein
MPYDISEQVVNHIVNTEQNAYIKRLREKEEKLDLNLKNQEDKYQSEIFDIKQKLKKDIHTELSKKVKEENETALEILNKELDQKSKDYKKLMDQQASSQKEKRTIEESKNAEILSLKKEHLDNLKLESEKAKRLVEQDFEMKIRENEKKLDDQKRLINEQKRKLEQGSVQIQGEVQEEAIEDYLKNSFPLDTIQDIKKGAKGADCIQTVNTRENSNCGIIYYESKRTKNFSNEWISKFKKDMQEKNADIGILVTEKLPNDTDGMSLVNGIIVCTFQEFRGLSHVLRDVILNYNRIKISQENIGDKKELLYQFLTGNEFQSIMESFVQTFNEIQKDFEREQNQSVINFSRRKTRLDSIKKLMFSIFGRFSGIAGSSIKKLEMENDNEEKKSNVEILKSLSKY